jgi:hypothetical protein
VGLFLSLNESSQDKQEVTDIPEPEISQSTQPLELKNSEVYSSSWVWTKYVHIGNVVPGVNLLVHLHLSKDLI